MRGFAAPKVYRSFEEFERDELRKLDGLHTSIDDMLDEMFADELDFDASKPSKATNRRRATSMDKAVSSLLSALAANCAPAIARSKANTLTALY